MIFFLLCLSANSILYGVTGEFLLIPASARQNALGTACVAMADDVSAVFYNPAGLGIINRFQVQVSDNITGIGEHKNAISFFYPVNKGGISAFTSLMHNAFNSEFKFWKDSEPLQDINLYSLSAGLGYGLSVNEDFAVGINGKFIKENIDQFSADTFALDFGLLYQLGTWTRENTKTITDNLQWSRFQKNFRIGLAVQNIGGKMNFLESDKGESLPIKMATGFYYLPHQVIGINYQYSLLFKDSFKYIEDSGIFSIGLEFFRAFYLSPRLGYLFQHNVFSGDLSLGLGIKTGIRGLFYQLDYAYKINHIAAEMGDNHIISLTIGHLPVKIRWIELETIGFKREWYPWEDIYVKEKTVYLKQKYTDQTNKHNIFIKPVVRTDDEINGKSLDEQLYNLILKQISSNFLLRQVNDPDQADSYVDIRMQYNGKSIISKIEHTLKDASVSDTMEIDSEVLQKQMIINNEAILFITRSDRTNILIKSLGRVYVTDNLSELDMVNQEKLGLKSMALEIIDWLEQSAEEMSSCYLEVYAELEGVNIFIDQYLAGQTDAKGILKLMVMPGMHRIFAEKGYFSHKEKIFKAEPGGHSKVFFSLQQKNFYSDLIIHSYPSGANVFLNDIFKGQTPLRLVKMKNNVYNLRVEGEGQVFEEEIKLDMLGYDLEKYYIMSYDSDDLKADNEQFWTPVILEPGIKSQIKHNSFQLQGKAGDEELKGSGYVSREFIGRNIQVAFNFQKVDIDNCLLLAGIIDKQKNAVLINYDGEYISLRYLVHGYGQKSVKALPIGKRDEFKLVLKYNKNQARTEAFIDSRIIDTVKLDFTEKVRILILLDGKVIDKELSCMIENIRIRN